MDRIPARLADHPTVRKVLSRKSEKPGVIDADWLRQLCLDAGADDVAFASVENPALASEREHVDAALPGTLSYISLVVKMNRDNVRSTARSVANQEFHRSGEIMNEAAHRITRALQDAGYRAINPSMSFPMEMDRFPGRIWVVAHKPVAVAAGLGVMGIHRNVIHPKFGNFILLGTILVAAPVTSYGEPLDYSPCLECKLCVAACPVGAIKKDGEFDFVACSVHNYREFMGGFTDWAQTIADSADADDFRARQRFRERVDVAEPVVQGELQGGVLPGGVSRGRGRHRALSRGPEGVHGSCAQAAAGQEGDALRAAEFSGQGARRTSLPPQAGEGGGQRDPRSLARPPPRRRSARWPARARARH
jgi:ferredoxin